MVVNVLLKSLCYSQLVLVWVHSKEGDSMFNSKVVRVTISLSLSFYIYSSLKPRDPCSLFHDMCFHFLLMICMFLMNSCLNEKMLFHDLCFTSWCAFSMSCLYDSLGKLLNMPKCNFKRNYIIFFMMFWWEWLESEKVILLLKYKMLKFSCIVSL